MECGEACVVCGEVEFARGAPLPAPLFVSPLAGHTTLRGRGIRISRGEVTPREGFLSLGGRSPQGMEGILLKERGGYCLHRYLGIETELMSAQPPYSIIVILCI